jgi:SAM-dependent methyltransferase
VDALRQIHRALVPGGLLVDMHPIPPTTRVEVRGKSLGELDDTEFMALVAATEAPLAETDLFAFEEEVEFDWLERFDSGEELIEAVSSWENTRVPARLAERVRELEGPVDIWERVVLRKFRATAQQ